MIILEGPDGSGKTTLGTEICKWCKLELYHSGGPIKNHKELITRIDDQTNQYGKVVDRCSIFSEPVYGLGLRGKSLLSWYEFEQYLDRIAQRGWTVIFCMGKGPIEENKSWKSEDHMKSIMWGREIIHQLYSEIIEIMKQIEYPRLFVYNFSTHPLKTSDFARFILWRCNYVRD